MINSNHKTTMTPEQRQELVRILRFKQSKEYIEKLASLTDYQIHLQWLCECRYTDFRLAPIPIAEELLFEYEKTTGQS